jgi:hypothetical protein
MATLPKNILLSISGSAMNTNEIRQAMEEDKLILMQSIHQAHETRLASVSNPVQKWVMKEIYNL